jgi:hypothetical protein
MRKLSLENWMIVLIVSIPSLDVWFGGEMLKSCFPLVVATVWVEFLLNEFWHRIALGAIWLLVPYAFYRSYRKKEDEDLSDIDFG